MMIEQWTKWEPLCGVDNSHTVSLIAYEKKSLAIELFDNSTEDRKLYVLFDNTVIAYRYAYETIRLSLIGDVQKKYGVNFLGHSFFKIDNSLYVKEILEQSNRGELLKHFVFVDGDLILDVVATKDPEAKLIR